MSRRLYGCRCDRHGCARVVVLVDAYCCHRCASGLDHTEACDRRQEEWREQEDGQAEVPC